jgi:hypothetical protein
MNRLDKRESFFCEDVSLALIVKSGDMGNLRFVLNSGYPLNYNVMDSNGMCYDVVDLAEEHGQDEIASLFKTMQAKGSFNQLSEAHLPGPIKQEINLSMAGKTTKKFVMANSKDDWRLFQKEVGDHFGLPANKVKIVMKGDPENKKLKWNALRADRNYAVASK